ncbi:PREDICTED: GTP-binding protein YPT6-like [Amphimedon queenslandica]|uniref:Roc domain-containing protein n=2 Tax=Amphimedon queenslandica TaxID=400682 RepID=A0AAN0K3K9_AMPQE|nr:PREDICTED: GTP-binding protein YPT6-like [Amphimedon queenslandica]|eukprot:XP_019863758.1 PREDICTED: GTP-binding protein YPT6-like [Amphimedon queenslandica]
MQALSCLLLIHPSIDKMANHSTRGELLWRKVTFVGEAGSGKTTLIKQFCEGKFSAQSHPTVGADYGHKHCTIGDTEVEVTFWDLAGSPEYRDIYKHLLPQSELCILVFDVSKLSVKSVEEWLECVTQYVETSKLAIFINKADLIDNKQASTSAVDKVKKWLLSSKLYSNLSVYLTRGITDKEVKEYITYLLSQTLPDDTK